jgi:anti-anti-sigma regulatory factor
VLRVGAALRVDLGGVSFIDREGVELLLRLRGRDVALVNCTPFVAEQLKAGR